MISAQADIIAIQFRTLWYRPEEYDSAFWVDYLERQWYSIDREPIPVDDEINKRCAEEVSKEFTEEFNSE